MKSKDSTAASSTHVTPSAEARTCGLVMPISALDGVSAEHWVEVRSILMGAIEAVEVPKFTVRIVSDADEIGIIQKRIVQNVYASDIVVCDVSGKNPNVMFELGMRLAFDKPVVIVKDDKTDYSFDTGIIEHLTYPRDLRFSRIVDFKESLASKVVATYKASTVPDHSPFLKNFGRFHVASLSQTEVSPEKLTLEILEEVRREINRLSRRIEIPHRRALVPEDTAGEGTAQIIRYLIKHLADSSTPGTLLIDDEFAVGAERACEAHRYFHSPEDFRQALEHAAKLLGVVAK
jgi:hypothetical protein